MATNFKNFQNGLRLVPQAADPSNPVAGDLHVSDGTARASGLYVYNSGSFNLLAAAGVKVIDTETTTATITIDKDIILASSAGGAYTITIPTPVGNTGKSQIYKKTTSDLSVITLSTPSGTVDGASTTTLNTLDESLEIISDGTNWIRVERVIPGYVTSYTPSYSAAFNTPTSVTAKYRREGKFLVVDGVHTGSGSYNTGVASISLPSGLAIDATDILSNTTTGQPSPKVGTFQNPAGGNQHGNIVVSTTTSTGVVYVGSTVQTTNFMTPTTTDLSAQWTVSGNVQYQFKIPVSGWKV